MADSADADARPASAAPDEGGAEAVLRRSPLHSEHLRDGAKMVPFGGWEMPLSYPTGTLMEHERCRSDAVMFDVSHLGTVRVEGRGAFDALQWLLTNDLRKISPGRAQYTHLLDPGDASVTDDIIVWWRSAQSFDVMPNASNTAGVRAALSEAAEGAGGGSIQVADVTADRAVIAVQGPRARERLRHVMADASRVPRFAVGEVGFTDTVVGVAGTGYTGEDGVELAVPSDYAPEVWTALAASGVLPAGLGARDTLRLEACLPLHGHELGPGITPLDAGLGWVVAWDKGDFRGREALAAQRERGPSVRLRALVCQGRRPPRSGQRVVVGSRQVGRVTSGNFSPHLGCGVALALCERSVKVGDEVTIDVRGSALDARVVKPPFTSLTPRRTSP